MHPTAAAIPPTAVVAEASSSPSAAERCYPVDAFATLATAECAQELALFLTSLRHQHPTTPIYVAVTSQLLDRIADGKAADGDGGGASCSRPWATIGRDADNTTTAPSAERRERRAMAVLARFARRHQRRCAEADQRAVGACGVHGTHDDGDGCWGPIHWVPLLDRYGPIDRQVMERRPGIFFPTQHSDFMMEKAVVVEYALAQEQLKRHPPTTVVDGGSDEVAVPKPMVLFLDCDVCTLAPWPVQPASCPLVLSPHGIRAEDEAMWGAFNGGVVGVRDPSVLFEWRKHTLVSRFHDQASLENVAAHYLRQPAAVPSRRDGPSTPTAALPPPRSSGGAVSMLGREANYGYWRMFQQPNTIDIRQHELPLFRMGWWWQQEQQWACAAKHDNGNMSHDDHDAATATNPSSAHRAGAPQPQQQQLIFYGEAPLQSVHTHFFSTGTSVAMPLFNRLLLRWMGCSQTNSYKHLLRLLV